jgi:phosphotransferase system HPr (HPr) family protein
MIKKVLTVKSDIGLHARPCVRICEIARSYEGSTSVSICNNATGVTADAKSILSILSLAVDSGQSVLLSVDGGDEEKVFQEVAEVIESDTVA